MNRIKEIAQTLAIIKDEKVIEEFLESILTNKEVDEISSRWELVKLLDSGMSQRKISDKLSLSLCKITRGAKELKKKSSAFKEMINIYNRISGN